MSKPIIDIQTIKTIKDSIYTIFKGALGAMTFGAYHQFNSNKIMEQNNQIMELKHKETIKFWKRKSKFLKMNPNLGGKFLI